MNLPEHHELITWLLDGDPAVRWQVLEDLTDGSYAEVSAARQRVASEGWGARLLSEQDDAGTWAQGLYLPKWTSTTYTLLLLQRLGLAPGNAQALAGCKCLWDGARYTDGGLNLVYKLPETCVTGMLVLLGSYFGYQDERIDEAVRWLLRDQLPDGGWNCQARRKGSRHGSFHSTITVLEALLAYRRSGGAVHVQDAADSAEEFFLRHRLFRSHRTGAIASEAFLRFPFPPQWHFDLLRGVEYFRACGRAPDRRLADAVELLRLAQQPDGTWKRYRPYPGLYWFPLEAPGASRITTLRCRRVLRWWDANQRRDAI
jgi:hypothetical protein